MYRVVLDSRIHVLGDGTFLKCTDDVGMRDSTLRCSFQNSTTVASLRISRIQINLAQDLDEGPSDERRTG